jgi:predicted DNA-binding protein (MmcQ/YjbR family)
MSSSRTAKPAKARATPRKPGTTNTKSATATAKAKSATAKAKAKTAPPAASQNLDDPAFQKVRALCLALPDTKLTMTWGSPHFRVADKIFCGFGSDGNKQVLGVKLERSHALRVVKEARFWPAPYVGKHGWVSFDVARRKSWDEVAALIRESYELIAPKASLAKLR